MCMNHTGRRIGALLLLFACVLAVLLSAVFVSRCTGHEHDHHGPGGSCAVCAQLCAAKILLKTVAFVLLVVASLGVFFFFTALLHTIFCRPGSPTPISLKVRLNN